MQEPDLSGPSPALGFAYFDEGCKLCVKYLNNSDTETFILNPVAAATMQAYYTSWPTPVYFVLKYKDGVALGVGDADNPTVLSVGRHYQAAERAQALADAVKPFSG